MTYSDSMSLEEHFETGSAEGSKLVRFLYPAPAERKVGKIIRWWEKRRLAYNAVVAGCVTGTAFVGLLTLNPPSEVLLALLAPGLPFLVMANVCYTLGWMVESLLHKIWGRSLLPVGPALFRAGLTLAVGVAFVIPTIILMIVFVVRLVTGNL